MDSNWSQLKTIVWLRWRLTRNQFSRGGKLNVIVSVIGTILGILLAVGAGVGGVFAGTLGLSKASPFVTMCCWDGVVGVFLFLWFTGVIAEIQRAESVDLARLMHLPVSLKGVFAMNYLASHVTFSLILFVPAILGVCIGLVWTKGLLWLLLLPLGFSFIFVITAWTYCLRGWLIALMVNPRRRRNVIVGLTMSLVLMGQIPNLYFNIYLRQLRKGNTTQKESRDAAKIKNEKMMAGLKVANDYVPLLWLPRGAMGLADGNVLPACLGTLGALAVGGLGLKRAYRSTLRFYLGQDNAQAELAPAMAPVKTGQPARKTLLERRLPFVSEDVSVMALGFFRSLTRAPEVKMGLFANFVVVIAIVPFLFLRSADTWSENTQIFYTTGAVGLTFLGLIQQMFNLFGFDRDGFRLLVLSPAKRRDVLLAKNLSLAPVACALGMAIVLILFCVVHLPFLMVLAAFFKLAAMFLMLSLMGNFISLWVPYRVTAGSLKATKPPVKTVFLILATQLLFPILMIPIFIPALLGWASKLAGWWPMTVVDALLSIIVCVGAALVYRLSLPDMDRAMERREKKVLLIVSREAE